jgi:hypothetical protein
MGESVMNAWVAEDGSYGAAPLLQFDSNALTDMQWERLTEISDRDKLDYVKAILDKNNIAVCEIEMENFGEEWGL